MPAAAMKVVLGIATYLRPEGLARALVGVEALDLPEKTQLLVAVADNDPGGSARDLCATMAVAFPFPLHYLHVGERGVSFVRNALADFALSRQADCLVFLDDDESPEPRWLAELLEVRAACRADLVGGPVVRAFPEGTPEWHRRISFFEARQEPTGVTLRNLDSGNLLVNLEVFSRHRLFFDPAFALTGGEDALFSAQARKLGLATAWAAGARVHETVSPERLKTAWMLARSFRIGTVTVMLDRRLKGPAGRFLGGLGKTLYYGGGSLVVGLASLGLSPYQKRRSLIFAARAAGLACGMMGLRTRMPPPR